jgi:undecaprenyl-diphosphatase
LKGAFLMKKTTKKHFYPAAVSFTAFVLWTLAVLFFDVHPIGPRGSSVGFSSLNLCFHNLTGVNMTLYTITDWAGLVPVGVGFFFALLGLIEWIKRKNIFKVDFSILVLGGFYLAVLAAYLFFEETPINYRPVLINGYLETSYPSSTTLLVLTVMPTAAIEFNTRIKSAPFRKCVVILVWAFTIFMVVGRLLSGVHWITDIVGGILLSAALDMLYVAVCRVKKQ